MYKFVNFVEYYQMHFANCSPVYGILTFLNFEKAFLLSDVRIRSDWFVFLLDRAECNWGIGEVLSTDIKKGVPLYSNLC